MENLPDNTEHWGYDYGHLVYYIEGTGRVYADTGEPVDDKNPRPCSHCKKAIPENGHDPCIQELLNVKHACCGHGKEDQAYIILEDGSEIRFKSTEEMLKRVEI